jgi:hypothetical protein
LFIQVTEEIAIFWYRSKIREEGRGSSFPHKLPSMPQYQRNVNLTAIDYQRNRNLLANTLQFQILRDLQVVSILRHLHLHKKSLDSFIIDEAVTATKTQKGRRRVDFDEDTVNVEDGIELGYIAVEVVEREAANNQKGGRSWLGR